MRAASRGKGAVAGIIKPVIEVHPPSMRVFLYIHQQIKITNDTSTRVIKMTTILTTATAITPKIIVATTVFVVTILLIALLMTAVVTTSTTMIIVAGSGRRGRSGRG